LEIPKDIINEIIRETSSTEEANRLITLCNSVYEKNINVGYEQLIRAMLIVSNFDVNAFGKILNKGFFGDPRDVLMMAHSKKPSINYGIDEF